MSSMTGELEVQSPTTVLLTATQLPDRPILPSFRWKTLCNKVLGRICSFFAYLLMFKVFCNSIAQSFS